MIHTYIPYAPQSHEKNLGFAYNNFMQLLPDDDWACFLDHDAMFTTKYWYKQLETIIEKYPEAGCFTAKTNRVHNKPQLYKTHRSNNHDINHHRVIGAKLQRELYEEVTLLNNPRELFSGVLILIKKSTWQHTKFMDGFLGVDNDLHLKLLKKGMKVYLMEGVYVYHWYRADGDRSHLPR